MQDKFWQYKQVEDLKVGDTALILSNNQVKELSISSINKKTGNKVRFYRLNVEPTDNYFASGICTHNTEGEKKPDKSCKPKSDNDFNARELAKSCGKNPAPAKGCRTEKGDKEKADQEQKDLCKEFEGKGPFGADVNCNWPTVKEKVMDAIKAAFKGADGKPTCELSDKDYETMVKATCEAAESCGEDGECVREDSLISTPSGLIPVKDLKANDEVFSYKINNSPDANDPTWFLWASNEISGEVTISTVAFNKSSYWHSWYQILLSDGTELNITYEHPVLVKAEGYPSL